MPSPLYGLFFREIEECSPELRESDFHLAPDSFIILDLYYWFQPHCMSPRTVLNSTVTPQHFPHFARKQMVKRGDE